MSELGGHAARAARGRAAAGAGRVAARHRAGAVAHGPRDRDPHRPARHRRGAGRALDVPVINMLTHDHHPCQALADLIDAARALRPARGTEARLRRRRQQRRPLAADRHAPGRGRAGDRDPARAGAARGRVAAARRGGRRRPRDLHGRVGEHGRRGRRRAQARAARPLPARRGAARARRATTRSRSTACPRTPARRSPRTCSTATRSAVWDQAENRLHAQKALLELLFSSLPPR